MRPYSLLLTAAFVLLSGNAQAAPQAESVADPLGLPPPGDYLDYPVYYDHFLDRYATVLDLPALRDGLVRVQHYDPVDTRTFAWERSTFGDYTWWMQMQEMRFLLPLIASSRESDNALADDWLRRWFGVHLAGERSYREWGEPMTWGYRAMVFVYYLRTERRRAHPDEDVVGMLLGAILEHQQQLAGGYFDASSNHGLIAALGLYETTRVYDDPKARLLACERLRALAAQSVSARGFHREHAAGYHFVVMRWLDEMAEYLGSVPAPDRESVDALRGHVERMRDAAYYLQDQHGGIPQIGDTDSVTTAYYGSQYRIELAPGGENFAFDPEAGYAIHKGSGEDRRYVVFRVPSERIEMSAHAHCDALAVVYAVDGEVLLGDGGRYSYSGGPWRSFFQSGWAHNTLMPAYDPSELQRWRNVRRAEWPRVSVADDTTRFSAGLTYGSFRVARTVVIPAEGGGLVVTDTLRAGTGSGMTADGRRGVVRATMLWNLGSSIRDVEALANGEDGVWAWRLRTIRDRAFELLVRCAPVDSGSATRVRVAHGEDAPALGWYSPGHGALRAAPVVVVEVEGASIVETRVEPASRHRSRR